MVQTTVHDSGIRAPRIFEKRAEKIKTREVPGFDSPLVSRSALLREWDRRGFPFQRSWLSRAIEELEGIHLARKARESSAASPAAESALPITVEEQSASQVENTAVSESSAPEDPEGAVGQAVGGG